MAFSGLFDIAGLANAFIEKQVAARKVGSLRFAGFSQRHTLQSEADTISSTPGLTQHRIAPACLRRQSHPSWKVFSAAAAATTMRCVGNHPPTQGRGGHPLALCQPL
jgi:hypothetical protein